MRTFSLLTFVAVAVAGMIGIPAAARADETVYVVTYVDVTPSAYARAAELIRTYRAATRTAPGNRSVEALQETGRPGRFVVVEAWDSQASFEAHQTRAAMQHLQDGVVPIAHSPSDRRVHHGFSVSPASAPGAVYAVTHVDVVPRRRADAEAALQRLAEDSRHDRGNMCYDVFQQEDRPNHFTLYAVWHSEADFAAHEQSAHRLRFRETLAPWLGALYDERLFTQLE